MSSMDGLNVLPFSLRFFFRIRIRWKPGSSVATLFKKKKSLLKNSVKIPTGTARILIQWSPFRFNADRIFHAKRVEPIEFRFRVAVVFLLFFFVFFCFTPNVALWSLDQRDQLFGGRRVSVRVWEGISLPIVIVWTLKVDSIEIEWGRFGFDRIPIEFPILIWGWPDLESRLESGRRLFFFVLLV